MSAWQRDWRVRTRDDNAPRHGGRRQQRSSTRQPTKAAPSARLSRIRRGADKRTSRIWSSGFSSCSVLGMASDSTAWLHADEHTQDDMQARESATRQRSRIGIARPHMQANTRGQSGTRARNALTRVGDTHSE
jgi:hypothetical protein